MANSYKLTCYRIGDWEKHINKIGSILLMKMGYKPGEDYGKDGRGIYTPVEAKLRLGKGAIGMIRLTVTVLYARANLG